MKELITVTNCDPCWKDGKAKVKASWTDERDGKELALCHDHSLTPIIELSDLWTRYGTKIPKPPSQPRDSRSSGGKAPEKNLETSGVRRRRTEPAKKPCPIDPTDGYEYDTGAGLSMHIRKTHPDGPTYQELKERGDV